MYFPRRLLYSTEENDGRRQVKKKHKKGEPMLRAFTAFSFVVFMITLLLSSVSLLAYDTLTLEKPIARLTFEDDGKFDRRYRAHYVDLETEGEVDCFIYGAQFQVDARFMKIREPFNLFGVEPRFVLERISGRYLKVKDANKRYFAYDLDEDEPLFFPDVLIDTTYGSSVYSTIDTDLVYTVYLTNTGLLVRSEKRVPTVQSGSKWWQLFD